MSEEGITLLHVDDIATEPVDGTNVDNGNTTRTSHDGSPLYCVRHGICLPTFIGLLCLAGVCCLVVLVYRYVVPSSDWLARHHEPDFLTEKAGLSELPPYWLDYIQKVCKIVGVIIVFGPDKPGQVEPSEGWFVKAKKLGVTCVACYSIAMMIYTLVLDIRDMINAWHAAASTLQAAFAVVVIFATSSNQVGCWSIYGIARIYDESDPSVDSSSPCPEKMQQEKGRMTLIYYWLSDPVMSASILLLACAAPALVAYLPFLLPILLALWIQAELVMNFAAWRRAPATPDDSRSGDAWLLAHFGSTQQGLFEYVVCATFWPWLVCFGVPLACRLYSGQGYWESLALTLTDRYLQDYIAAVEAAAEQKILLVWAVLP